MPPGYLLIGFPTKYRFKNFLPKFNRSSRHKHFKWTCCSTRAKVWRRHVSFYRFFCCKISSKGFYANIFGIGRRYEMVWKLRMLKIWMELPAWRSSCLVIPTQRRILLARLDYRGWLSVGCDFVCKICQAVDVECLVVRTTRGAWKIGARLVAFR